jgi:hypothetical protein
LGATLDAGPRSLKERGGAHSDLVDGNAR